MKSKLLLLVVITGFFMTTYGQQPADVYRKPLKEVLTDIENRYNI